MDATKPIRAVVVGAGVAGTTCAASLSTICSSVVITLVDPASSLKIANTISRITQTAQEINVSSQAAEDWCREHNIAFARDLATRLTQEKIHLASGAALAFDMCCLATGARPVLPQGLRDGRFREYVYTLRDTDSVEKLKAKLKGAKRVIVVGAGGIAMEVVHEMVGCEVFWVVKGHIGGSFFDAQLGALVAGVGDDLQEGKEQLADDKNIDDERDLTGPSAVSGSGVGPDWLGRRDGPLLFNRNGELSISDDQGRLRGGSGGRRIQVKTAEVESLMQDSSKKNSVVANLSDGTSISCDMIIVGAGVTPNTDWLQSSGLDIASDGGVVSKAGNMSTSMRNVFAAGDCSHVEGGGENWFQVRVWTQAFVAGRAAAGGMRSLAGGEGYEGLEFEVFAHATKFFGRNVVLLGQFGGGGLGKTFERIEDGEVVRVHVEDGRVRGAVLIGDIDCAEVFENLIVSGLDVSFLGEGIVDKKLELDEFFD